MTEKLNYSLPSGFNIELLPGAKRLEQKIMGIMIKVFEKYGFSPIETPAVERLEVLQAKGNQGDNILYGITPLTSDTNENEESRALKFDQTIPLAAYIARHLHQIHFPFARYQMDMVFRGERAKTGRYRQFRQCDIDVVGREKLSLLYDAQIPAIIYEIFQQLSIGKFVIRINNRKILTGFFDSFQVEADKIKDCIKIIDTLEKVGETKVKQELKKIGISAEASNLVMRFINLQGTNEQILEQLETNFSTITNSTFQLGIQELKEVITGVRALQVPEENYQIDLSIARGLDYYTGTVYETTLVGHENLGSICSGGRYEELVGLFTGEKLPGVGISIGLTRLMGKLLDLGILEPLSPSPAQVMILNIQSELMSEYLKIAQKLRAQDINVLVNFDSKPIKKQLDYANKLQIPLCILLGDKEQEEAIAQVKNMRSGEQITVTLTSVVEKISNLLKELEF